MSVVIVRMMSTILTDVRLIMVWVMVIVVLFLVVYVVMVWLFVMMMLFMMNRDMHWNWDRDRDRHWYLLWLSGCDNNMPRLFGELMPAGCQMDC